MNLSDQLNAQGFLAEIAISGEMIANGDSTVIATVNHQPRFLEMMESGYLDKEPVEFEILKGYAGGTATMFVNGLTVPVDLRGAVPKLLMLQPDRVILLIVNSTAATLFRSAPSAPEAMFAHITSQ